MRRSWLFRIFSILALVIITAFHVSLQSNMDAYTWNMVALSASIPFVNIYLFNVAQSIIAIFLAGDFMKRDKKLDTAEVTYVRPMSNTDYIAGKTWGVITVFVGLNIVALLIAAFINLFASESGFHPWSYVFYLLTLSIPSLIFILGLSFCIISLLKNQAVTLILLLGFTGVTLIYLGNAEHGAFDFFAITLPNLFSDVTGHPNLIPYLLQRGAFVLAGLGFLTFTTALMKRLPQHPKKRILLNVLAVLFLAAGTATILQYVDIYRSADTARTLYREKYREYALPASDFLHLKQADITLHAEQNLIRATASLAVENRSARTLNHLTLYLNPGLKVEAVAEAARALAFRQDAQVVLIEKPLAPGNTAEFRISYSGPVDELICYLDVDDKEWNSTLTGNPLLRFGKRYAYVSDTYTLLSPESIWYPVTTPPVNPDNRFAVRRDFSDFTLRVTGAGDRVVLSQGVSEQRGDTVVFSHEAPLPSLSVAIGDYEIQSLQVDSVLYEIYHFRGHDYFSKEFTHLADTLVPELRAIKNDYEVRKNRDYPFRKLVLAETPIAFASYARTWKGMSGYVQPEIIFLPEKGAILPGGSFKLSKKRTRDWERQRNRELEDIEVEIRVMREFIDRVFLSENVFVDEANPFVGNLFSDQGMSSTLNKYELSPQLFNHTNYYFSADFPVMDVLIQTMLKQEENARGGWWRRFSGMNDAQRAAEYLKDKSFEEAVTDRELKPEIFYEMLKLKATYMKNYVLAQRSTEEFKRFMKAFGVQYRFSAMDFSVLNNDFIRTFGMNLMDRIPEWYSLNRTPRFIIRSENTEEVLVEDFTRYLVSFQVHNDSALEGILSVRIEEGRGGGRGRGPQSEPVTRHYIIPAGGYREIRTLTEERPNTIVINTNISQNLPSELFTQAPRAQTTTTDTLTGVRVTDDAGFRYNPKEITVDNEDAGFRLIESNQKNTLQSLLKIGGEDHYKNINFWMPPSRWTATVGSNFHGDYIKSGYYKRSGSGRNLAEWKAEISIPGYYDVFVYNAYLRRGWREEEETGQTYLVTHDYGTDEVTVRTDRDAQTWLLLGRFYFTEGEAKITLHDKGGTTRQLIFADAVRWELKNN